MSVDVLLAVLHCDQRESRKSQVAARFMFTMYLFWCLSEEILSPTGATGSQYNPNNPSLEFSFTGCVRI